MVQTSITFTLNTPQPLQSNNNSNYNYTYNIIPRNSPQSPRIEHHEHNDATATNLGFRRSETSSKITLTIELTQLTQN